MLHPKLVGEILGGVVVHAHHGERGVVVVVVQVTTTKAVAAMVEAGPTARGLVVNMVEVVEEDIGDVVQGVEAVVAMATWHREADMDIPTRAIR